MRARFVTLAGLIVLLATLLPAPAQNFPTPLLTAIVPAGGQAGQTVEITLLGSDLDEIASLYFSNPAFKAERLPDPPPPKEKGKTPPPPPIRFKVTIPANVPLGSYDVRAIGKWGISNPRSFLVGDQPEVLEAEPNNDVPQAQQVALNSVVNGVISAKTDVDYCSFAGKKGQRVVVTAQSATIDSRLTPFLQLYDPAGKQLASNVYYKGRNALVDVVLPADGDYLVRLCENTYQNGGADYFYRLHITTGPWVDAAYPPVVNPGKPAPVTLLGRNLPGGQPDPLVTMAGRRLDRLTVTVTPPKDPASGEQLRFRGRIAGPAAGLDGFEYRLKGPGGLSNPILLTYAEGPVVLDNEKNQDTPQAITLPCELCGRIEKLQDVDRYRFAAKQGDVYVIEAVADRLGSPVDLFFLLRRADNQQVIGEFDDSTEMPTAIGRFYTRTGDPRARFSVPADGDYELMVRSHTAGTRAGPRFIYHLSIRPEAADFRLVLVGNNDNSAVGCTVRQGGSEDLQVVCFRQDGFEGPVTLAAEGLPPGVTCPPQLLGPKQRDTVLVVTAAADAKPWAGEIRIVGKAMIDGKEVARPARAGTLVWPIPQNQNVPAVSRLARSICLAVRDKGPFSLDTPVKEMAVAVGSPVSIKVNVNRQWADFKAQVQLTRVSGPVQANGQLLAIPNVNLAPNNASADIKFQVPNNAPPGSYNLVFKGVATFPFQKDPKDKKKANVRVEEATPPITFTIYDSVAELSADQPKLVLAPGSESALAVKVKRLHDYKGEFSLQLVPTSGLALTAAAVKVPPGGNEARLVLKAPANAKLGTFPKVLIRATAVVNKITLNHDLPIAISIAKEGSGDFKTMRLLPEGSAGWKYLPAAMAKGDAWRGPDFNDAAWKAGKAPLGDGEDEIATRKGTQVADSGQPYLFRRAFEVPSDVLNQKGALFRLAVASDDSAIAYVNGQLVDKDEADHEFMYWNREVDLPAKLLKPGKNAVAVQVFNKQGSSDLYFDLAVNALIPVKK